jgi:hypothetical protein
MVGRSAAHYLLDRIPTGVTAKTFLKTHPLTSTDVAILAAAAQEDARRYVYNAVVSFLSGIGSLRVQHAAWAVTKMYYTAFYVGRAALCRSSYLIFHAPVESGKGYTQYELDLVTGQRAVLVDKIPSTHKLVAKRFRERCYPRFIAGLTIDGIDPIAWLMAQREYWQYRSVRFSDPDFPETLDQIDINKVQRFLAEYSADTKGLYLSDPTHALLAVPFRLLEWSLSTGSLVSPGIVEAEELAHLRKRCRVGDLNLNAIGRFL